MIITKGVAGAAMAPRLKRVAAYCRVSTLKEEQADSYATQCAYYRRLVEADPALALVDVYGDCGVSGLSTARRKEFTRMMGDCMAGKIDLVMTKSVSRFARNLADGLDSVRALKEKGIPVIFEKENLTSTDPGSELMLSILATMAQEEINTLSQSIRWAHEQLNASGNPSTVARYGYRKEKVGGIWVWRICESEAERVRLAFHMAAQHKSRCEILAALDDMEAARATGFRWTYTRLYGMLKSEAYVGDLLTNKYIRPDYLARKTVKNAGQRAQYYIEAHHEPIIDRETFARAGKRATRLTHGRARV